VWFVATHFYRFRSTWRLDADPAAVYRALEGVREYPRWWPQVIAVEQLTDDRGRVTCRSLLPYRLVFEIDQRRRDPAGGVLEAGLTGDLDGFCRWTITAGGPGTVAVFDEEVETRKPLVRRLEPMARPVFRANHAWMMRGGQRGLARRL
jgi:hypothetical protein